MKTHDPIQNSCRLTSLVALALAAIAVPAHAGQEETVQTIVVRPIDRHPATDAAARALLARLDRAAIEVCGGSVFSLREVKAALHATPCWKDAMAGALTQIGSRRLTDAFPRGQGGGRGHAR